MIEIDKDKVTFGEELTMQDILKLKRGKARIYAEAPPNDPSSPTANPKVGNNEAPKEPFGAAFR